MPTSLNLLQLDVCRVNGLRDNDVVHAVVPGFATGDLYVIARGPDDVVCFAYKLDRRSNYLRCVRCEAPGGKPPEHAAEMLVKWVNDRERSISDELDRDALEREDMHLRDVVYG